LSVLAARYRVEVRDERGRLITVLEDDSKSFTVNFIRLLVSAHYSQNDAPALAVYDVFGDLYYTGSTSRPALGVAFQPFNIDYGCWPQYEPSVLGTRYKPYPGVWLGTSPCSDLTSANAPCGDLIACCDTPYPPSSYALQPTNLTGNALCFGIGQCSPPLTESGWAFTITSQWHNQYSSPVTVGSMALVFGILTSGNISDCYVSPWYAAIVDNLPTPVTVSPGWYITVSYTIYFPV